MNNAIRSLAVAFAAVPINAAAQSPPRFEITPQVGYFAPQEQLGGIARVGNASVVRLNRVDPGVVLIATGQTTWPSARLRTRITAMLTSSLDVGGEIVCMPGQLCLAVFRGTRAHVRVAAAVVDAVYVPIDHGVARPYVLLGAGLKRYAFSWSPDDPLLRGANHVDHALAVHSGIGLELDVLGASIRAELSDFWTPKAGTIVPAEPAIAESVPGRRAQHDLSVSVGYRLFRF